MAKATARRTPAGIVVTFSRDLNQRVDELAALLPLRRAGAGSFTIAATHSALDILTRAFADVIELDESLRRAMIEVRKRRIIRRQIVGPRATAGPGPFVASPKRSVFHRTNCPWAGEIGTEMLVMPTPAAARTRGFRPCRLCRPLDKTAPKIPDELLPQLEEDEPRVDRGDGAEGGV